MLIALVENPDSAEQRQVIRFGPAADEHDFLRSTVNQRGRLAPGLLQLLLGHLAKMVDTGRVTIHFAQARHHGREHSRRDRRRRVVVEVITLHLLTF